MTQPANGTVVITGGGTGLTYAPNAELLQHPDPAARHLHLHPDTAARPRTVSVTVTCVDDDPVAVDDAATVAEDSGATAVDVLANDTDVDGGPKSISSVTQPANGTVVITGGGTGLTYAPNAELLQRPAGHHARHLHLHAAPAARTATVSMTVTCVDDNPVAVADTATVVRGRRGDRDRRAGQRHRRRRRPDSDQLGDPAGATARSSITGGGTGLTYQPERRLLQRRVAARHLHLHPHPGGSTRHGDDDRDL